MRSEIALVGFMNLAMARGGSLPFFFLMTAYKENFCEIRNSPSAKAVLAIIADALAETGAGMQHVVRTVVYVIDMADTERVARAHAEMFGRIRPASTLVQVAALTPAAARVEIEAMAIIGESGEDRRSCRMTEPKI